MSKPGGDYWGLLNFDEEEKRLGKNFIQTIRRDYDETLKYLLTLDSESQFGQIVLQDFYKQGYFPRLKNETIEGMNAYQRICPMGKGSGKCVALAMLWASSLAVCGRFPIDQIIIVANKAHLFVFLDDGETVNHFFNAKWYNHTRINNDSEFAVQAKTVSTGSDVNFIYIPGKGICDIYNGFSEVKRGIIETVTERCSDFLGAPLMVGDLDEVEFRVNESSLPDPSDYEIREDYQKAVYELAEKNPHSPFAHSKYAFRDWRNTYPEVYAYASMREYEVGERAKTVKDISHAIMIVASVEDNYSIFDSRDRIALPDETLLFGAGDDRDRALLLFSLLQKSEIETDTLLIGFSEDSSYVCCNDKWIDLSTMSIIMARPEGLTHLFDHQQSWESESYDSIQFEKKLKTLIFPRSGLAVVVGPKSDLLGFQCDTGLFELSQKDLHLIMGNPNCFEYLANSLTELEAVLQQAKEKHLSLDLFFIILDSEASNHTRITAAKELEETMPNTSPFLLELFSNIRIEDGLDLKGASDLCLEIAPKVAEVLGTVGKKVKGARELLNLSEHIDAPLSALDSCRHGALSYSTHLKENALPEVLEEMIHVQVITPQAAAQLWQELRITDIESLKRAALENKIQKLKGFSIKSEEKILEMIDETLLKYDS